MFGRNDNQIKIKGHRIELGEISNAISTYTSITKCFISVKQEKIIAYFTAKAKIVINDLRNYLTEKLPFYAIPNYFMQLESFPLTLNGKIDKKKLEEIELIENATFEEPRNEFEKNLAQLWQKFLNIEKIGINDNFFNLGGDSLIAIRMQVEAFRLGLNVSYADIFAYPTIKQLSEKSGNENNKNETIKGYDYSKISKLISQNKKQNKKYKMKLEGNILLTGATGFVGAHVLNKLISETKANIYCLVRSSKNKTAKERLQDTMNFYFKENLNTSRVKVIEGDIADPHLGLKNYKEICKNINVLINSAAIVKHYGTSNIFNKTNIEGAKNIIDFCLEANAHLYHLSTLSVSGNVFADDSFEGATLERKAADANEKTGSVRSTFNENNLYINQDISNIYVYTKFIAERLIYEAINEKGLRATVIRLGNVANRYTDGKFQINISENAYLNRILAFIKLGCVPDYMLVGYGEFTPVDYVAAAICKVVEADPDYTVLHLYNDKHIPLNNFIELLNKYGINMRVVPEEEFLQVFDNFLNKDQSGLSGIINDFDKNRHLVYDSGIDFENEISNNFLENLGFEWPKIEQDYVFKYLDYLKDNNLLKL